VRSPASYIGRKAAKATAKHSARGVKAKATREPVRAITLLGIGAAVGALGGWVAARAGEPSPAS
jgi:hypothetical protein